MDVNRGDIEAAKRPSFDQVVDMSLAKEASRRPAAGSRSAIARIEGERSCCASLGTGRFFRSSFSAACVLILDATLRVAAAEIARPPAQDQCRGLGHAAERGAHTTPYIAKALGPVRQACIDATSSSSTVDNRRRRWRGRPGHRHRQCHRCRHRARRQGGADLGDRAAHAAELQAARASRAQPTSRWQEAQRAGGGVRGYQWRMGREALRNGNLVIDDAQFISQATAGRLAGIVTGMIDGVSFIPEDAYLAIRTSPAPCPVRNLRSRAQLRVNVSA